MKEGLTNKDIGMFLAKICKRDKNPEGDSMAAQLFIEKSLGIKVDNLTFTELSRLIEDFMKGK